MRKLLFNSLTGCFLSTVLFMSVMAVPSYAEEGQVDVEDAVAAPDPQDQAEMMQMHSEAETARREVITKGVQDAMERANQQLKEARIKNVEMLKARMDGPIPIPELRGVLMENTTGSSVANEVRKNLVESAANINSGKPTDENSPFKDKVNPTSLIGAARNAQFASLMDQAFCIPDAVGASPECAAKKDQVKGPPEDFISFAIGDMPWKSTDVVAASRLGHHFLVGSTEKSFINQGSGDPIVMAAQMGGIARENLRSSILNYLAARRAPTSQSASDVIELLLSSLVATGQVSSTDASELCTQDAAKLTGPEQYACSLSTTIGGEQVVSQGTIDKVLQYDHLLSNEFYTSINKGGTGSAKRTQVWLKAQQLAQDYRALRLLQMKTAAAAMNYMNAGR